MLQYNVYNCSQGMNKLVTMLRLMPIILLPSSMRTRSPSSPNL